MPGSSCGCEACAGKHTLLEPFMSIVSGGRNRSSAPQPDESGSSGPSQIGNGEELQCPPACWALWAAVEGCTRAVRRQFFGASNVPGNECAFQDTDKPAHNQQMVRCVSMYRAYLEACGRYTRGCPTSSIANPRLCLYEPKTRDFDLCLACSQAVGANVLLQLFLHGIDGDTDHTGGNSFKHCLVACQSAKTCGPVCARAYWDGREWRYELEWRGQQDLANNQIGYDCASTESCWDCCMQKWNTGGLVCPQGPCPPPVPRPPRPRGIPPTMIIGGGSGGVPWPPR